MSKESSRKSYYPALDSLRVLAMLAILVYHYAPHRMAGGFIGVDLFLVISGFLTARSLMKWETKGFGRTYVSYLVKRVIRLGVPMVLVFWHLFPSSTSFFQTCSITSAAPCSQAPAM